MALVAATRRELARACCDMETAAQLKCRSLVDGVVVPVGAQWKAIFRSMAPENVRRIDGLSYVSTRLTVTSRRGLRVTVAHATDLAAQVLSEVGEQNCGVLLYGSRARGTSRQDSDIDVLKLVDENPRSYSAGLMNVTAYTVDHLTSMAARGSLFVRHLVDEGVVLSDPNGAVANVLAAYRDPPSYVGLKTELRLLLEAMSKADAAPYRPLLDNLAKFTVRSALYVRAAEHGQPIFELEDAAIAADVPQVASLIRSAVLEDFALLVEIGMGLLDVPLPDDVPSTFQAITIWSIERYPLVSTQLERAVAGNAKIDYSLLSLPPS